MGDHPGNAFKAKIIFSDIDGTLLDSNHRITQATRKRILTLERQGIPFILVSARMPDGITTIQKQLGNHAPIVCYSGGLIYSEDGDVMDSTTIDLAQAVSMKRLIGDMFPEICCNTYGYHTWLVDDDQNPWILEEEKITGLKAQVGEIESVFAEAGGIHKFLLMGKPDLIRRTSENLRKSYPELSISASKDTYLEVTRGDVKKSAAVHFLCKSYGVTVQEAMALGDGENDMDMLEAVRYGFAMGNASDLVKRSAAYVTLDNDHEGLLMALQDGLSISE